MTDAPEATNETTEAQPLNLFITGADEGAGLLVTKMAIAAGHNVTGATANGSDGARRIREAGGIPVYPDLTREGEVRSMLAMAKADMIVNLWPQALNGLPFQRTDYAAQLDTLRDGTHALVSVAGQMGIKRIIQLSFGFVYGSQGDDHGHGGHGHDDHGHGHHDIEALTEEAEVSHAAGLYEAAADAEASVLDGGIPGYVLRAGTLYTGGLPSLIDHLRSGGLIPSGAGHTSWLHEADLAAAVMLLIERTAEDEASATVFNIADDAPSTFDQFADLLGQTLGTGNPTNIPNFMVPLRTNDQQRHILAQDAVLDTSKIKEHVGWEPQFATQREGIEVLLLQQRAADAPAEATAIAEA